MAQEIPVIIQGGTIHVGNGTVIQNGTIVLSNGKIMEVGDAPVNFIKNARIVDASGKHVYPGLICMNTYLGLNEIDQIRATRDYSETGEMNPNVRSLIAYNTDSKVIPTVAFNGVMLAQVVPQGGVISGTSSLMKTGGWNWEDAAYKIDEGVHLNWPEIYLVNIKHREAGEAQKERNDKRLTEIENFMDESFQYSKIEKPETFNARFDAMKDVFAGTKNLYVHVNSARGIISAVNLLKKYPNLKIVIVGGGDSPQLTGLLKQYNIAVVLDKTHRLPLRSSDDVDQPFKTPAQLVKAGVTTAIGLSGSWQARNLCFNAGTAVAYGLGKEEALSLITLNAAKIMGVDKTCGSLERGKDANVLICDGDILDMRTSNMKYAFFQGEETEHVNNQQLLYEKYMKKYGLK